MTIHMGIHSEACRRMMAGLLYWAALFIILPSSAGEALTAPPDLINGGEINHQLQWTLGSTGARGWIHVAQKSTDQARQIYITKVNPGSPADGVLKEGDVILGVISPQPTEDGEEPSETFTADPRKALPAAITEAETTEHQGKLQLNVWRDGKTITPTLQLKVMGSFAPTVPYNCEKSKKIVELAVAALLADGLDNGNPNPIDGDGIPGVINALGLMATGQSEVMPMVKAKMTQIAEEPVEGMKWGHAWCLLALAEYHLQTGDKSVLPAITRYATETAQGQSISGTWGHGFAAEDGILGGYGAMNQVSITHTLGLILAEKCGVKAPVVRQAIDRSLQFFDCYVGKGSIPYGDHGPGDRHGPDDNGKSSGVALAFNLAGNKRGTEFLSRLSVYDYAHIEKGHASNFFHLNWQALSSAQLGPQAAAAHFKECQWYYELLRDWRGKFRHHEAPGFGEPNRFWDATGGRLLFFCLPRKELYLTGKGGYIADEVRGEDLQAIVESGRYTGRYDQLSEEQLLTRLGDWCHATRWRAAQELAKREGDWCVKGLELYANGTLEQKLGAARLFEALKSKAAPAVDALTANVTHEDLWLRVRTVKALGAIGEPARSAVPALMDAVAFEEPTDHRKLFQRTLAVVLFSKRGLLADQDALATVPREKLIATLKHLLTLEEGQAVTVLAGPLNQLTFDELKPLWPMIVYRVEHRLSQNVMAANMQPACLDLLAKHKVEEGLRLVAYLFMAQNGWGAGGRNKKTLAALRKYGKHAERAFFPLQMYLEKNMSFSKEFQAFKKETIASTESPELVSIAPYLGDYQIGDHFEKLLTMREFRKQIEKDNLAQYWKTYEMIQDSLQTKPEWATDTNAVLAELMAIPRAADIIAAHHAINEIKQSAKDKTIPKEDAIEQLISYRDKYDINNVGPNLVYWYSLMWSNSLKAGKELK